MKYTPFIMMLVPLAAMVAPAEQDVHSRDAQGRTPLMLAVEQSWHEYPRTADKVCELIAAGADVNARDNEGNTALMLAPSIAYFNHEQQSGLPIIKALVEAGADVHALNADGMNLLEMAVCQKDMADPAVVEYLRAQGLVLSLNGRLAAACAENDVPAVKECLAAGADPNFARGFPLVICMSGGTDVQPHDAEIIRLLLAAGANPNLRVAEVMFNCAHGGPSLHPLLDAGMDIHLAGDALPRILSRYWACEMGFPKRTFSRLLRLGADPNAPKENEALLCHSADKSSRHGPREIAYLLSIGVDPAQVDAQGRTALDIAREQGRQDIIPLLENPTAPHPITTHGVDAPAPGQRRCGGTPLTEAARKGDLEKVKALLAAGADIEALGDVYGSHTALWYALFNKHTKVAELLVKREARTYKIGTSAYGVTAASHMSADFNMCWGLRDALHGEWGRTPLHEAVIDNDVKRLERFAYSSKERNAVDAAGNSAMHYLTYGGSTVQSDDVRTARILVKHGVNINARNHKGETPLHCIQGVGCEWIEVEPTDMLVRYLIEAGADVHARTHAGLNALELAMCLGSSWPQGSLNPVADSPSPVVKLLTEQGLTASPNALLIGAAAANDVEAVKRLLAAGATPNAYGPDAPNALVACLGTVFEQSPHDKEIVALLLAAGADPNMVGMRLLERAQWSSPEVYDLLFAHGLQLSRIPQEQLRQLMASLKHRHSPYYDVLLQYGAPAWDVALLAAEMRAAVLAGDERAIYRVHHQYYPVQTPLPGEIPAPFADGKNTGGDALMLACAMGNADVVRILLCMECNVEGTDTAGRTPIEYAAAHGYDDVVYLLLNAGAKRISQAAQLAEQYGHKHVAGILRQFIQQ